jgi:hypothetical protein
MPAQTAATQGHRRPAMVRQSRPLGAIFVLHINLFLCNLSESILLGQEPLEETVTCGWMYRPAIVLMDDV